MSAHPAQLSLADLLKDCEVRRQRRSGPGGQHRNKVETGIFVEHLPTGIRAEATEKRSQEQNRSLAIHRLRMRLAVEYRVDVAAEAPSPLWRSRILSGRIHVAHDHEDFPRLLSEALDLLQRNDWDTKLTSTQLGCSHSQFVKFLKQESPALAELNRQRDALGLGKLK